MAVGPLQLLHGRRGRPQRFLVRMAELFGLVHRAAAIGPDERLDTFAGWSI
jgi:hypothetical protein